jgi:hypothetical protein
MRLLRRIHHTVSDDEYQHENAIQHQGAAAQRKHELDYVAYTRPGKWQPYRSPAPFLSRAQEKIERCA